MDCKKISDILIDYIDSNLDEKSLLEVEKHLNDCPGCTIEYKQTQEMFNVIEQNENKIPDNNLKNKFEEILSVEKVAFVKTKTKSSVFIKPKLILQFAAAIALLFSGYLVGYNMKNDSEKLANDSKINELHENISEMKQMMALNLLNNESASQRIKAVNYTEEMQNPDNKVIDALINTLNSDKSSNVRLAAVYSLARFKTNKRVKEAFISTLNKQDDPMVQIVIINLLVEMDEIRVVDELKILLQNRDLQKEVKEQAELGVKILS